MLNKEKPGKLSQGHYPAYKVSTYIKLKRLGEGKSVNKIKTLLFLAYLLFQILVLPSAQETPPKYVGTEKCKMCHSDQYDAWSKTMMAKAYESLVMVGEEKNEKCLSCHATGFGKGGFKDAESTPELKGVTCEACHGPGEKFMKAMMEGDFGKETKNARERARKACPDCHFVFIHGEGHKGIK